MSGQTKLKFRVVYFSSQDSEHTVTELLKHGPQSKGWLSEKFCNYPQELILQFSCPVRIRQLQFLSHQSKISSKIELYISSPNESSLPLEQLNFKRLGYLSLDNNEKSQYQARELKSVYIDAECLYLKLLLNKCHTNSQNVYNQVGLIAINAIGEEIGSMPRIVGRNADERLENEMEYDPHTAERLKALYAAKAKAIENEDFDEAKKLKETIERLKSVGRALLTLEEKKRLAIENEDYDTAKVVKVEIERLRNAVMYPFQNPAMLPPMPGPNRPLSGSSQPLGVRPSSRPQPSQFPPARQLNEPPAQDLDYFPPAKGMQSNPGQNFQESRPSQSFPDTKSNVHHEDMVIPTIASGKGEDKILEEMHGGADNPARDARGSEGEAETLSAQNSKFAEPLIDVLGIEICKMIFSKNRSYREGGLKKIEEHLALGDRSDLLGRHDEVSIFASILGAIRYTIGDKIAAISIKAMNLLRTLIELLSPNKSMMRGDCAEYLNEIVKALLDKIGDNSPNVRELAERTFIFIARSDVWSPAQAVNHVLKSSAKQGSTKHVIGRTALLNSLVQQYGIDNNNVPFQPVVDYALLNYKHSNNEIRTAAYNLILTIYSYVGARIQPYIQDLRPAQLEQLNSGFGEIDNGKQMPKAVVEAAAPKKVASKQASISGPASIPKVSMCVYCGKRDNIFSNEDNMDIHWYKDCPMLVSCANCNQVIEILHLNEHLLRECELSNVMRQCSRCKEAVHIEEYEQHIEEQSCFPGKPARSSNRCPLCHQDVSPGVEGWKQHILTEGCPNNDRSNF
jgi:centrosomal protein CEP104